MGHHTRVAPSSRDDRSRPRDKQTEQRRSACGDGVLWGWVIVKRDGRWSEHRRSEMASMKNGGSIRTHEAVRKAL